MLYTLYALGGGIILILTCTAIRLQWQVNARNKANTTLLKQQNAAIAAKRADTMNSLNFIARALLEGQVELAEASIRISHLLDHTGIDETRRDTFNVFDQVSKKIAHIPILKEWKALSKTEKQKHLATIASTEEHYRDFSKEAAKDLVAFTTDNKQ